MVRRCPLVLAHLRKEQAYARVGADFGCALSCSYSYVTEPGICRPSHVQATVLPSDPDGWCALVAIILLAFTSTRFPVYRHWNEILLVLAHLPRSARDLV